MDFGVTSPVRVLVQQHQFLIAMPRAHRYDHPPARTQLLDQCRRNIRRSGRHHDRVEWRQLRPAEPAIAGAQHDIGIALARQRSCRTVRPVPGSPRWSRPCRPARRAPPPDSRSRCRPPARCRPVPGRAVRSSRRRRRAARSSGRDRSAGAHWRRPPRRAWRHECSTPHLGERRRNPRRKLRTPRPARGCPHLGLDLGEQCAHAHPCRDIPPMHREVPATRFARQSGGV